MRISNKLLVPLLALSLIPIIFYITLSESLEVSDQTSAMTFLGHITIIHTGPDGNIKNYIQTDNLVVEDGLQVAIDHLFGTTLIASEIVGGFEVVGIGTGTTAPVNANSDIQTQRVNKRSDAQCCNGVENSGTVAAIINGTWLANTIQNDSGSIAISEAGLFDTVANASGIMFARQTFTAINVNAADELTIEWTVTASDSDGS